MTDLGPLVKLGDVRQWLKEGDRFQWGSVVYVVQGGAIDSRFTEPRRDWNPDTTVHLISPRWERVNAGEPYRLGDVVYIGAGAPFEADERLVAHSVTGPGEYRLVRTRLATRKDVRVGMRVRGRITTPDSAFFEGEVESVYNDHFNVGAWSPIRHTPIDPSAGPDVTVRTVTDPHAALREEFRFIADRVDWELVAEIHRQRGWVMAFRSAEDCTGEALRECAGELLDCAMGLLSRSDRAEHILVDLTSGAPALYLESLNAAAYHAKCEELWPRKTEPAIAAPDCVSCRRPMGYGARWPTTASAATASADGIRGFRTGSHRRWNTWVCQSCLPSPAFPAQPQPPATTSRMTRLGSRRDGRRRCTDWIRLSTASSAPFATSDAKPRFGATTRSGPSNWNLPTTARPSDAS